MEEILKGRTISTAASSWTAFYSISFFLLSKHWASCFWFGPEAEVPRYQQEGHTCGLPPSLKPEALEFHVGVIFSRDFQLQFPDRGGPLYAIRKAGIGCMNDGDLNWICMNNKATLFSTRHPRPCGRCCVQVSCPGNRSWIEGCSYMANLDKVVSDSPKATGKIAASQYT